MKKLLLALALSVAAAAPVAAQAPVLSPYYDYFGKNKIVYDKFDWKTYHSTHFAIYFYDREEVSLQKVASYAESAYDDISRALNFQIPKPINIIYYATHSEFEQTNTMNELHPGRRRRVRAAHAQPDGPARRPARREAPEADRPRADARLPVRDPLRRQLHPRLHLRRAAVADRGHGLLLRQRRGRQGRQMVLRDAVLADQVPEIAERGDLRLLRLPLRPRGLRLHRGGVGPGRRARLRLRVPRPARAQHRPRPEAHLRRLRGGLRHPVPPLPAPAVHQDPDREGRADRLRRPRPADRRGQLGGALRRAPSRRATSAPRSRRSTRTPTSSSSRPATASSSRT